jgi:thioredoxin 1
LYPASADAKAEIAEAVHRATGAHKRVLIVFGGNWCYDCHVLDEAFHSLEILPTLEKSFELVDVDIGQMDKNLDLAKQYDVPLDRGVPAIAVLESDGKLLFSQKRGEFEAARSMAPEDILDFLNKWKPIATKN